MGSYRVGVLVVNLGAPQWGPGKIVHISGDILHIVFRDLEEDMARKFRADAAALRIAAVQSDPILDNLPPLVERNGRWVLPHKRLTIESLKRKFLHDFPAGFSDPKYLDSERTYKLKAHITFQRLLGIDQIRFLLGKDEIRQLADKAKTVEREVNVLSVYEKAAFEDALKDDIAVGQLFTAFLGLIDAGTVDEETFERYASAVSSLPALRGRVATWPVATLFPYLAIPDRFMFLKPEVTQEAARSLGFDLKYESDLNWKTYEALLRMGEVYLDLLRALGARDFIDVQSFVYVCCGGYDSVRAKRAAKAAKRAQAIASAGESTEPGYRNDNGQVVVRRTDLAGNDHEQYVYELKCTHCGHHYGANGSDIWQRKCPECQGGCSGLEFTGKVSSSWVS